MISFEDLVSEVRSVEMAVELQHRRRSPWPQKLGIVTWSIKSIESGARRMLGAHARAKSLILRAYRALSFELVRSCLPFLLLHLLPFLCLCIP